MATTRVWEGEISHSSYQGYPPTCPAWEMISALVQVFCPLRLRPRPSDSAGGGIVPDPRYPFRNVEYGIALLAPIIPAKAWLLDELGSASLRISCADRQIELIASVCVRTRRRARSPKKQARVNPPRQSLQAAPRTGLRIPWGGHVVKSEMRRIPSWCLSDRRATAVLRPPMR